MKRIISLILIALFCLPLTLPVAAAERLESGVPEITGEISRKVEDIALPDGTKTGALWTRAYLNGYYGDDRQVNVLEVDLSNTHLSLEVINHGKYIVDRERLTKAAKAYDEENDDQTVLAAVCGDLWMTNVHSSKTITKSVLQVTRGVLIIDSEIWASQQIDQENLDATNGEKGAPAGERACFGVTYENQPVVGSPDVQITISVNGKQIKPDGLNRLPANNAIIVYNHRVNTTNYAMNDSYEVELEVEKSTAFYSNGTIKAKVVNIYPPDSEERPALDNPKRIVLTGRGTRLSELADSFKIGDEVTLSTKMVDRWGNTELWQDVEDAVGGQMTALYNGEPALVNGSTTAYPSALIGYKNDGTVMITTVTSRKQGSREALRLYQSYEFCRELGYNSVFFLDGGGSCTFVTLDDGEYKVRHQCSDGSERAVINGLALVWNEEPVCEKQGSMEHIKVPLDLSAVPSTYLDGALIYELTNNPNQVELSYSETEKALCMKTTVDAGDAYASLHFTRLERSMAEEYPYIVMKVKTDKPEASIFSYYYASGNKNGASGKRIKSFIVEGADAGWQYVTVDMLTQEDWTGKINYLRLDAFESAEGVKTPAGTSIYIGAIVLCKTLEEAELVQTGWTPEGAVTDFLQYVEDHTPKPDPEPDPNPEPESFSWGFVVIGAVVALAAAGVTFAVINKKKIK